MGGVFLLTSRGGGSKKTHSPVEVQSCELRPFSILWAVLRAAFCTAVDVWHVIRSTCCCYPLSGAHSAKVGRSGRSAGIRQLSYVHRCAPWQQPVRIAQTKAGRHRRSRREVNSPASVSTRRRGSVYLSLSLSVLIWPSVRAGAFCCVVSPHHAGLSGTRNGSQSTNRFLIEKHRLCICAHHL